jgi:hypothetical protein
LAKENAWKKHLEDEYKEEKEREAQRRREREIKQKAEADALAKKEAERLSKLPMIKREMLELRSSQQKDRDSFKVKSKLRLGIRKKDIALMTALSPLKVPAIVIESNSPMKLYSNTNNITTATSTIASISNATNDHIAFSKDEVFHAEDDINLKSYEVVPIQEIDRTIHKHHNDHDFFNQDDGVDHVDGVLKSAVMHHAYHKSSNISISEALNTVHDAFPYYTSTSSSLGSLGSLEDSISSRSTMRSKIYPQLQVNILRKKRV